MTARWLFLCMPFQSIHCQLLTPPTKTTDLFALPLFCTKVSKPSVFLGRLDEHMHQDSLNPCYLQTYGFMIQFLEAACSTDSGKISRVIGVLPVDYRLLTKFPSGIDSSLANNFGRSLINMLSVTTTLITISVVGGVPFILAMICLGLVYYHSKVSISLWLITSEKCISCTKLRTDLSRHATIRYERIPRSHYLYSQLQQNHRLGHSVTTLLYIWRNDRRGNHPSCFRGVLEIFT